MEDKNLMLFDENVPTTSVIGTVTDYKNDLITTKELAEILGVEKRTINETVQRLLSGKVLSYLETKSVRGGNTWVFTEEQATLIKKEIQKHHNAGLKVTDSNDNRQIDSVMTRVEMMQNIQRDMQWLMTFNAELQRQLDEEKATNNLLMHTKKTYTASELAKEIGMKSAIELNRWLEEKGIQFKRNNTWLPVSKYSDKDYYEIKQEVLDNGRVIYNSRITQSGREFILKLFKKER